MSEEEKKAIETVENFIKYYKTNEQTGNRANLDVLREECQAIEFILNKYDVTQKELNNLKEIEQSHQEENGKLRVELNELERTIYAKQAMIDELTQNEEKLKIELAKEKEKNKEIAIKNHALKEENNAYGDEIVRLDNELQEEKKHSEYEWIRQHCLPQNLIDRSYISKDKIKEEIRELEQQIAEFKEYVKDSKGQEKIYWRRELAELVGARNSLSGLLEEK